MIQEGPIERVCVAVVVGTPAEAAAFVRQLAPGMAIVAANPVAMPPLGEVEIADEVPPTLESMLVDATDVDLAIVWLRRSAGLTMSVRLHRRTIGTSGSFQFIIRGINPSARDGQDFVFPTDLGSTPTIVTTTAVPTVLQLSTLITDPQQPMIRVVLRTIGPSAGAIFAIFSADLVMKTG